MTLHDFIETKNIHKQKRFFSSHLEKFVVPKKSVVYKNDWNLKLLKETYETKKTVFSI